MANATIETKNLLLKQQIKNQKSLLDVQQRILSFNDVQYNDLLQLNEILNNIITIFNNFKDLYTQDSQLYDLLNTHVIYTEKIINIAKKWYENNLSSKNKIVILKDEKLVNNFYLTSYIDKLLPSLIEYLPEIDYLLIEVPKKFEIDKSSLHRYLCTHILLNDLITNINFRNMLSTRYGKIKLRSIFMYIEQVCQMMRNKTTTKLITINLHDFDISRLDKNPRKINSNVKIDYHGVNKSLTEKLKNNDNIVTYINLKKCVTEFMSNDSISVHDTLFMECPELLGLIIKLGHSKSMVLSSLIKYNNVSSKINKVTANKTLVYLNFALPSCCNDEENYKMCKIINFSHLYSSINVLQTDARTANKTVHLALLAHDKCLYDYLVNVLMSSYFRFTLKVTLVAQGNELEPNMMTAFDSLLTIQELYKKLLNYNFDMSVENNLH
ncbi:PARG [Urbanus proteus nucleopolyhedrovirus]|uniref:PARG n=1 Tax=Urbanus proteus nucleopolyhedrovirus TaxID=1675866 RepID=A0A161CD20_9ABAC|nr:PARG [Urbanus proteus nucleopolyhedrovirus]AKR17381.1 PARG [Urbanus proteus nucleopolyhedrovirus]